MIKLRNELSSQERIKRSMLIEDNLFKIEHVMRATTIMFYVAFRNEVHTLSMIERALASGKRVGVPASRIKEKKILICELTDPDGELHQGRLGILEPKPLCIRQMELSQVDVVVLPGIAFDEMGFRLGYGGGYFDRLLNASQEQQLIGLAYEFQIISAVPHLTHDVRVQQLVTEQRIITCCNSLKQTKLKLKTPLEGGEQD
jgi:5-formyltetrahydrofolate cyclo-ligase